MTTTPDVTTSLSIRAQANYSFPEDAMPEMPKSYKGARATVLARLSAYADHATAPEVVVVRFAAKTRYRLKDGTVTGWASYPSHDAAVEVAPREVVAALEAAVRKTLAGVTVAP